MIPALQTISFTRFVISYELRQWLSTLDGLVAQPEAFPFIPWSGSIFVHSLEVSRCNMWQVENDRRQNVGKTNQEEHLPLVRFANRADPARASWQ